MGQERLDRRAIGALFPGRGQLPSLRVFPEREEVAASLDLDAGDGGRYDIGDLLASESRGVLGDLREGPGLDDHHVVLAALPDVEALRIVGDRLANVEDQRRHFLAGHRQFDRDPRRVEAERGEVLDVIRDVSLGRLDHAERCEGAQQALDLRTVGGCLDRRDQVPATVAAPIGRDDLGLRTGGSRPRDLHGRDLECRHPHEDRLAPVGEGLTKPTEQSCLDDVDTGDALAPDVSPALHDLADLERRDRPIGIGRSAGGCEKPDGRGRGRQPERLGWGGDRAGVGRFPQFLEVSHQRLDSRGLGRHVHGLARSANGPGRVPRRSKTRCSSPRSIATRWISSVGVSISSGRTRSARRRSSHCVRTPARSSPHTVRRLPKNNTSNIVVLWLDFIIRAGRRKR